jgi:hypothetical protein
MLLSAVGALLALCMLAAVADAARRACRARFEEINECPQRK